MQIEHERGYLIVAQNNATTDYVACARALAKSIRQSDPEAKICLLTDRLVEGDTAFDYVKEFPFGDQARDHEWKLANDWQCFYASPFRETIKIEADMVITRSIRHWFDICCQRDLVVTIGARNYHNQLAAERDYRRVFDDNGLPDVYNAITYWRLSQGAKEFFDTVRNIFENWSSAMTMLRHGQDQPINTDLAYALALVLVGPEKHILPDGVPGLIHMKPALNALQTQDWTKELIWEFDRSSMRIGTIEQMYPVHYHVKDFAQAAELYHAQ